MMKWNPAPKASEWKPKEDILSEGRAVGDSGLAGAGRDACQSVRRDDQSGGEEVQGGDKKKS